MIVCVGVSDGGRDEEEEEEGEGGRRDGGGSMFPQALRGLGGIRGGWGGGVGASCTVNENHQCTGSSRVPVTFSGAHADLFTCQINTVS